jgi:hypothetical protein
VEAKITHVFGNRILDYPVLVICSLKISTNHLFMTQCRRKECENMKGKQSTSWYPRKQDDRSGEQPVMKVSDVLQSVSELMNVL